MSKICNRRVASILILAMSVGRSVAAPGWIRGAMQASEDELQLDEQTSAISGVPGTTNATDVPCGSVVVIVVLEASVRLRHPA